LLYGVQTKIRSKWTKKVVRIREKSLVQEYQWSKETSVSDPDSLSPDLDPAFYAEYRSSSRKNWKKFTAKKIGI
jgi:hypothetical protein